MIKKLLSLFPNQNNKTYDLGKLQKSGFIGTLDDLSSCPNCKSKNIDWKFFIPFDESFNQFWRIGRSSADGYNLESVFHKITPLSSRF
jgi:hypothetical protein